MGNIPREQLIKRLLIEKIKEDGVGAVGLRAHGRILDKLSTKKLMYMSPNEEVSEFEYNVIKSDEDTYPYLLKSIPDYPELLFTIGNTELLSKKLITVVGSRKISQYGKDVIRHLFSNRFLRHGYALVSGLAYGVDAEIHKAALEYGIPTIAVIAGSIDLVYPKGNSQLRRLIEENGLVIAEFPPGRITFRGMFPMRNRILAGLSKQTIIIEAAKESGSLITAKAALEYNRDVCAVPGSVFSLTSEGCNNIIKEGAGLVYDETSLACAVGHRYSICDEFEDFPILETVVEKGLGWDGFTASDVVSMGNVGYIEAHRDLTKIEMEGILSRNNNGLYVINNKYEKSRNRRVTVQS